MRVLITGISGFVGSHLAEYLLGKDEVHGIKRWRSPLDNISHIQDNITLHDCDLTDLSAVISVLMVVKPDRIYHLAAQSYVPFSYSNPIQTLQTNVIGTANLLEAVRLTDQQPLIHICSSSEVYGQPDYVPMDEKLPLNPISPYGVSKVAEDRLGFAYYKAYGMKCVITRMFTHTGPRRGDVFFESSFARQVVAVEKGKCDTIYVGNLKSVRTISDVRDAVRAYSMLNDSMAGEAYNIGGNATLRVGDVLDRLMAMAKVSPKVVVDPARLRPADVTNQIPDCTKFKQSTGWEPRIPLDETLQSLLDYWRSR